MIKIVFWALVIAPGTRKILVKLEIKWNIETTTLLKSDQIDKRDRENWRGCHSDFSIKL